MLRLLGDGGDMQRLCGRTVRPENIETGLVGMPKGVRGQRKWS